jgi:hypothetical protein
MLEMDAFSVIKRWRSEGAILRAEGMLLSMIRA